MKIGYLVAGAVFAAFLDQACASTLHFTLSDQVVFSGSPLTVNVDFTVPDGGGGLTSASGYINGSRIVRFSGDSIFLTNVMTGIDYFDASFAEENGVISTFRGASGLFQKGDFASGVTSDGQSKDVGFGTFNISAVPLPASAPMFGAALLGLASLSYAAKRKKAAAASPTCPGRTKCPGHTAKGFRSAG